MELFKEAVPKLSQVAILLNPTSPAIRESLSETKGAAHAVGVKVQSFEVREAAEFDAAFVAIQRARADGVLAVPDPLVSSQSGRILEFAAKNRLPSMWGTGESVEAGGLISYGIDFVDHVRGAARYVDNARGSRAAEPDVEPGLWSRRSISAR